MTVGPIPSRLRLIPTGLRHYTRSEVCELLKDAGFVNVIRTDPDGEPDDDAEPTRDIVFCATRS